jgi:hypothetical protein
VAVAGEDFQAITPPARALYSFYTIVTSAKIDRDTIGFIKAHMSAASYERIMFRMLDDDDPMGLADVNLLLRQIATTGTARPYPAVATLAHLATEHWRLIRARLIRAGIADPLKQLPDMHAILDVAEDIWTENMTTAERDKFYFGLYKPEPKAAPPGFSEEETMSSFAAFEAAVSGT